MKNSNKILLIAVLIFAMITGGCEQGNEKKGTPAGEGFLGVEGRKIMAPEGGQIILHGINVVNKDPGSHYLGHVTAEDFARFRSWGFNVVRLGIIWDGLEPQPGKYNETYLKGIDEMIGWAKENGIYVFLDMHQDLYSVKFSDGAPDWATIDEGKEHIKGEIWSDAYLISPAVQTAFDNFWENAPAPDGTGIRDHYINLWRHIAERYAGSRTVIGYDIMNEPFPGSLANKVMPVMLGSYAKMMAEETGQAPPSGEELLKMWSEQREEVLKTLSSAGAYKKVIDPVAGISAEFESTTLTEFYQEVRDAIRKVDRHHIIFIEHSYFSNMGVPGGLQNLVDENGKKDSLVVYAAHGYDLVVDTDAISRGSDERVKLIFDRINETSLRLNIPVLVGEWGALHGKSPELVRTARVLVNEFNKHLFSDTFWAYYQGIDEEPFFKVIKKPYVQYVPGTLSSCHLDYETGIFECAWTEDGRAGGGTRVWVPDLPGLVTDEIEASPAGADIELDVEENSRSGFVKVAPLGRKEKRSLKFRILSE